MKNKLLKIIVSVLIATVLFFAALMLGIVDLISISIDSFKLKILYEKFNNDIKNEKQIHINNISDFYGVWKDDGRDFKNRYEAIIDKDSITVYKWDSKSDWKEIYWVGDFGLNNVGDDIEDKFIIESNNFEYVSSRLDKAAKSKTKEFTYDGKDGGAIHFISQYNDDYVDVTLNRYQESNDRLRVIKYQGERIGGYDENINKKININGYEISYPAYFDNEEEETRKEVLDDTLLPNEYEVNEPGAENNFIVFSPKDNDAHAELFIGEYKNTKFDSLDEFEKAVLLSSDMWNADNYEQIAIKETNAEDIYLIETICSTKLIGKDDYGMGFETHMLFKKDNMMLTIGVAYSYYDNAKYDYLEDYKKIIKNIRRVESP